MEPITIRVRLDKKTFRRFALFDTFVRQKRLRQPLFFALILLAFGVACFLMTDKAQNGLMGTVLTAIALVLPLVYTGMYVSSVNANARKEKLPREVYALSLTDNKDGIGISSLGANREQANYEWENVFAVYRRKDAIYLYMTPAKAFILPSNQASISDEALFAYLKAHIKQAAFEK